MDPATGPPQSQQPPVMMHDQQQMVQQQQFMGQQMPPQQQWSMQQQQQQYQPQQQQQMMNQQMMLQRQQQQQQHQQMMPPPPPHQSHQMMMPPPSPSPIGGHQFQQQRNPQQQMMQQQFQQGQQPPPQSQTGPPQPPPPGHLMHHPQHHQQQQMGPPPPPPPPQQQQHPPQPPQFSLNNLPLHIQPEYRLYEMNKRLSVLLDEASYQTNNPDQINAWWNSFCNDFFDDMSRLTIRNVNDENGLQRNYSITRPLIPKFFRSFNDGGVFDLFFQFIRSHITIQKDPQLGPQSPPIIIFETEPCHMITKHGRPMFAKILTEGHLTVEFCINNEFNNNDPQQQPQPPQIRIKHFMFTIRRHQELIPRSAIAILQDPNQIEQLSKNITKMGLTQSTINYLKLCSVLEPMQELMVKNQMTGMVPRECLKTSAMQRANSMRMGGGPPHQQQQPPQPGNLPPNMIQQQQQQQQQQNNPNYQRLLSDDSKADSKSPGAGKLYILSY